MASSRGKRKRGGNNIVDMLGRSNGDGSRPKRLARGRAAKEPTENFRLAPDEDVSEYSLSDSSETGSSAEAEDTRAQAVETFGDSSSSIRLRWESLSEEAHSSRSWWFCKRCWLTNDNKLTVCELCNQSRAEPIWIRASDARQLIDDEETQDVDALSIQDDDDEIEQLFQVSNDDAPQFKPPAKSRPSSSSSSSSSSSAAAPQSLECFLCHKVFDDPTELQTHINEELNEQDNKKSEELIERLGGGDQGAAARHSGGMSPLSSQVDVVDTGADSDYKPQRRRRIKKKSEKRAALGAALSGARGPPARGRNRKSVQRAADQPSLSFEAVKKKSGKVSRVATPPNNKLLPSSHRKRPHADDSAEDVPSPSSPHFLGSFDLNDGDDDDDDDGNVVPLSQEELRSRRSDHFDAKWNKKKKKNNNNLGRKRVKVSRVQTVTISDDDDEEDADEDTAHDEVDLTGSPAKSLHQALSPRRSRASRLSLGGRSTGSARLRGRRDRKVEENLKKAMLENRDREMGKRR